ncbi:family 20 glycosylhydrolase [Kribbella sp. NBC_01245]|uniref:family 20 glycosylhydrolase n=1 Tax=Kribbella sp. NBC_01245 TaxID=2903578 RepID=UPI002E29F89C|nr:family 20 glycosylhydrolase [Kribbella sp. NBC_01245]
MRAQLAAGVAAMAMVTSLIGPSAAEALPDAVVGNAAPVTVPALRSWTGGVGSWRLVPGARIVVDLGDQAKLGELGQRVVEELALQEGVSARVVVGQARAGDIRLDLVGGPVTPSPQGYRMVVGESVAITATSRGGVFNGTRSLLQALRSSPQPRSVARGTATDWPDNAQRGQMLDVGRKYFGVDYLKQQIRQMAWYKLNTFHLHLSDWNGFRIESLAYPEITSPQAYTRAELRDLERYAASYGVTIIPEIDLPGHAAAISKAKPELAFGCESMSKPAGVSWEGADSGGWTLDVTKAAVREFSRRLVAEVADLFDSPYVHIGTDEVPLTSYQVACPELVQYQQQRGFPYVADVFVDYINELDAVVRSHGKTTQVWQWWDYQQQTSLTVDKRVIVHEWLRRPEERAAAGYRTVGVQDGPLYVSPGFGARPGSYGFFDVRSTYGSYSFASSPGILGYHVARWSDRTQTFATGWVDYFARRPIAVVADRSWGSPAADVRPFLDRYDQVGDASPGSTPDPADLESQIGANTGLLSQTGWTAMASSQETTGEDGRASRAADNDPYTLWHSRYDAGLPQKLSVDLGRPQRIAGVRYMPRQDGGVNGMAKDFRVLVSNDGTSWSEATRGRFAPDRTEFIAPFRATTARHVALEVISEYGPQNRFAAGAELDVVRAR